jgi:hypothetical protein
VKTSNNCFAGNEQARIYGENSGGGRCLSRQVPWAQSAWDIGITLGLQVPYEAQMNWLQLKSFESPPGLNVAGVSRRSGRAALFSAKACSIKTGIDVEGSNVERRQGRISHGVRATVERIEKHR